MDIPPKFFVPGHDAGAHEAAFAALAGMAGRPVPALADRVYSITFEHNGEEWSATVGESLRGMRRDRPKKGVSVPREHHLSDPAKVLAIFPGNPFIVVTDHCNPKSVRSAWENPFLAGAPKSVRRFTPE